MNLFDRLLTQPIFNLLAFIYNFIGDFGVSIIIVTILIRLLMWPLVKKQLHQTKMMRQIQPELKKIKQKANGNRMLESTMLMELYREKNIKPFNSMLVLLIQIPIMIAIYRGIRIASGGNFNHLNGINPADYLYPFMSGFHKASEMMSGNHLMLLGVVDLTKVVAGYLPGLMIAILATVFQFYQTKQIMPSAGEHKKLKDLFKQASKGQEVDQSDMVSAMNRNMLYFTPIMTLMVMLALPGAVVLYYATTSLVAIGQQQRVLSRSEEELEEMASSHNAKRSRQAQEAVIIRKKATGGKEKSKAGGGKTVVRRIKAK